MTLVIALSSLSKLRLKEAKRLGVEKKGTRVLSHGERGADLGEHFQGLGESCTQAGLASLR